MANDKLIFTATYCMPRTKRWTTSIKGVQEPKTTEETGRCSNGIVVGFERHPFETAKTKLTKKGKNPIFSGVSTSDTFLNREMILKRSGKNKFFAVLAVSRGCLLKLTTALRFLFQYLELRATFLAWSSIVSPFAGACHRSKMARFALFAMPKRQSLALHCTALHQSTALDKIEYTFY
jgi:hypothetical protein